MWTAGSPVQIPEENQILILKWAFSQTSDYISGRSDLVYRNDQWHWEFSTNNGSGYVSIWGPQAVPEESHLGPWEEADQHPDQFRRMYRVTII